MAVLGEPWGPHVVPLGRPKIPGYPTHYKLDVADPGRKVVIELDGISHHALARKEADRRKTEKLASLGWTVLRFWNSEILNWIGSGMPPESSISMTFRRHGILPSPSKGC